MKKYTVDEWGSDPDKENDDCWTGQDYSTREEAEQAFQGKFESCVAVIVLGEQDEDSNEVTILAKRKNPDFRPSRDDDQDWRQERAMQAGMMGGCDAYNDAMGWSVESHEDG